MPEQGLPPYTVRISPRARCVRLRLSVADGLVVVVPPGFDRRHIPSLLEKRRKWLEKHLDRIGEQQRLLSSQSDELPAFIHLDAVEQHWTIEYRDTAAATVNLIQRDHGGLLMQGGIADRTACRTALRCWLLRQGRIILAPWLSELSRHHHLPFSRITIRGQNSRWGSCSCQKSINLNFKLLFLDRRLVQYVMMHELCHTVHLNHSQHFWELLTVLEPDCHALNQQMKEGWRSIPAWVQRQG